MPLKGLEAYQPSYMLLPNFNFFPGGQIQLGTILPAVKGGELPDPNRPKNLSFHVPVNTALMNGEQNHKRWTFDSRKEVKDKAKLQASISLLTGVGGHVSGEKSKTRELTIDCDSVQVQSFRPNKQYLAKSLDDEMLQTLARKISRGMMTGPPLYMVTGLMLAGGAVVRVSDERGRAFGAGVEGDLTSQGVPLNAGVDGEHAHSGTSTMVSVPTKPFILAYQIVRLRKKGANLNDDDQNKWGLFDDDDSTDLLDDWDIDWFSGGI